MCIYSKFWIEWEKKNLAPYAIKSDDRHYSRRSGSGSTDTLLDLHGNRSRYRTAFELDKDRITNSQVFRRLEYKTQVFVTHEGDNYRTRLTHTLEVAEIARHIARALRLNEHLTEAIALGHDLGHAPYGHTAEDSINKWLKEKKISDYYFCHNNHSLENVEYLEPGYDWDNRKLQEENGFSQGLNLTVGVREGILVHNTMCYRGKFHRMRQYDDKYDEAIKKVSELNSEKGLYYPGTLEAQVVKVADVIAHRIHDLEDGIRSNMINKEDIIKIIKNFFDDFPQILIEESSKAEDHLIAKGYGTKISADLINTIIILTFEGKYKESEIRKKLNEIILLPSNEKLELIKEKIKNDDGFDNKLYQSYVDRIAALAFLLHMWRDDEYLKDVDMDDKVSSFTRILKYYTLLEKFYNYNEKDENKIVSTYNLIAFLRGIMLANVIEHSFWRIHSLLNPDFRKEKKVKGARKGKNVYVILAIVDGIIGDYDGELIKFKKYKRNSHPVKDQNLICFEFENSDDKDLFIKTYLKEILRENGSNYEEIMKVKELKAFYIQKIIWTNKSVNLEETESCYIVVNDNDSRTVPIEKISVYFTGYKELCPSVSINECKCKLKDKILKARQDGIKDCPFRSDVIKWLGINSLVEFQELFFKLNTMLSDLIGSRIHNGCKVIRMGYMGDMIIKKLLDEYFANPRLMHDRVWIKLRKYPDREKIDKKIEDEWLNLNVYTKEKEIISDNVIDLIRGDDNKDEKAKDKAITNNQYILIRRIIEHIAGMTDRYIAREYLRITVPGKEVEQQDETYFFS